MKINKAAVAVLLLVIYVPVKGQTSFTEKKAGHVYYVKVPDYMSPTANLNDIASTQYINSDKNAYMIIIDDSKEHLAMKGVKFASLKDFHEDNIKLLKTESNEPVESGAVEFEMNGNKYYQSELNVHLKEPDSEAVKITYLITYAETKGHYYQILCWTLTSEFKNLVADFKKIAASIKD